MCNRNRITAIVDVLRAHLCRLRVSCMFHTIAQTISVNSFTKGMQTTWFKSIFEKQSKQKESTTTWVKTKIETTKSERKKEPNTHTQRRSRNILYRTTHFHFYLWIERNSKATNKTGNRFCSSFFRSCRLCLAMTRQYGKKTKR